MSVQDRIADPGFVLATSAMEKAIADLRALGVPMDSAVAVVHRVYGAGRDRGLYLGLRRTQSSPAATN